MIIPINLRVEYGSICGKNNNRIVASNMPTISWGGFSDVKNDVQTAYHVIVKDADSVLWDSGEMTSSRSYAKYQGSPLPVGKRIDFAVRIAGNDKKFSGWKNDFFFCGQFDELPPAKWICCPDDKEDVPAYFRKEFSASKKIKEAAVFISGIGYSEVTINGRKIDDSYLNPAVSDYTKSCYYCVIPEVDRYLSAGQNCIGVVLADGWRRNQGDYLKIYNHVPEFFGTPCLWAAVRITYCDCSEEWILSDESWQWCRGPIVKANLFNGETYDASCSVMGWDRPGFEGELSFVRLFAEPLGRLRAMALDPIGVYEEIKPVRINCIEENRFILDFGKNISGILSVKIPDTLKKGDKIILRHSEILYDDGTLNVETLRGAENTDIYIASGDRNDLAYYQPTFTYHGFRYAEIRGIPFIEKKDVTALMICTALEDSLTFECGNAVIKQVADMSKLTEISTIHSLANDTCGRSERLFWITDGVIRFENLAYLFDIGKLFPHTMRAVLDTQDSDGTITCTAPFVYGRRPGDSSSSAYFLLAKEAYLRTGNIDIVRDNYASFEAWFNFLLKNTTNYVMNYAHYGDWASPAYACDPNTMGGGAGSRLTPPTLYATCKFLTSALELKEFALILGKEKEAARYQEISEKIKQGILEQWYVKGSGKLHNGSHSCQALGLCYEIIPEEDRKKAAKILRDDLVKNDYRFTTGFLTGRLLAETLIKYGYIDEYYALVKKDTYPSLGYMIQCGATTLWEKYEYLTGSSMNAHAHNGHGAVCSTYYKYLAGIIPVAEAYSEIEVNPVFPDGLNTVAMTLNTVRGDITVSWRRLNGTINLCVTVPFNTKAHIHTPEGVHAVGSGFHSFTWKSC